MQPYDLVVFAVEIGLAGWVSIANFVLLCVLAVLGLWIKDKFFTPLKLSLIEATNTLTRSIEAESAARKIENATMQGIVTSHASTLATMVRSIEGLQSAATKFGEAALNLAREQGRQAEREHYLIGELSKVKIKQDIRIRKETPEEET